MCSRSGRLEGGGARWRQRRPHSHGPQLAHLNRGPAARPPRSRPLGHPGWPPGRAAATFGPPSLLRVAALRAARPPAGRPSGRPIWGGGRPLFSAGPPDLSQRAARFGGWAALVAAGRPAHHLRRIPPLTAQRFLIRIRITDAPKIVIIYVMTGNIHDRGGECWQSSGGGICFRNPFSCNNGQYGGSSSLPVTPVTPVTSFCNRLNIYTKSIHYCTCLYFRNGMIYMSILYSKLYPAVEYRMENRIKI